MLADAWQEDVNLIKWTVSKHAERSEFFVVLHMYALFPPFHSLRLYNKKSFRSEFSQICISLFLGTVFCSGGFFVLMHEERWKYLPNLVPAFSCGFRASFSQKKTLCGWKTQILLCPPSAVLQHPALVIANKSCASCLCESSSYTRGKFNNDPSRNNGKPVGDEMSRNNVFLTCCDSGPRPGLSYLRGPAPAPAPGSLPCESCNGPDPETTPRDIPA